MRDSAMQRRQSAGPLRLRRRVVAAVTTAAPEQSATLAQRELLLRRGGSTQDNAFYACDCGATFTAAVDTSVHCPHCGSAQEW